MQITVVGGGIIGCAAAWRLAQGGARVMVCDRGRIGGEASWAGAGMLAPGGEFGEDSRWGRLGVESLAMYPGFVSELEAATGRRIDFRVCGAEEMAGDAGEMERRVGAQRRMGIRVEALGDGRWWYPDEAVVNPRDLVAALRVAGEGLGVEYREGLEVSRGEGEVTVWATGAWGPEAYPVKGHLIRYDLAPGSLPRIIRQGHYYVLQRATGETIAGADMERAGFDRTLREAAVEEIRGAVEAMVPELRGVAVAEAWNGLRPGSATGEPVVGRRGEGREWDAYGHFRNGILLAPVTARLLCGEILSNGGRG
jgi:glycine oxidase